MLVEAVCAGFFMSLYIGECPSQSFHKLEKVTELLA